MIHLPHRTCPQCERREVIKHTCQTCGYEYPTKHQTIGTSLLRLGLTMVVATYAVLVLFLASALGLKFLVFPVLSLISRVS